METIKEQITKLSLGELRALETLVKASIMNFEEQEKAKEIELQVAKAGFYWSPTEVYESDELARHRFQITIEIAGEAKRLHGQSIMLARLFAPLPLPLVTDSKGTSAPSTLSVPSGIWQVHLNLYYRPLSLIMKQRNLVSAFAYSPPDNCLYLIVLGSRSTGSIGYTFYVYRCEKEPSSRTVYSLSAILANDGLKAPPPETVLYLRWFFNLEITSGAIPHHLIFVEEEVVKQVFNN